MGLAGCTLAALKATFRAGIARWKWMPRPADILEVYRETTVASPVVPLAARPGGCPVCDGTGWRLVGDRTVTPCDCPKGQARGRRRGPG